MSSVLLYNCFHLTVLIVSIFSFQLYNVLIFDILLFLINKYKYLELKAEYFGGGNDKKFRIGLSRFLFPSHFATKDKREIEREKEREREREKEREKRKEKKEKEDIIKRIIMSQCPGLGLGPGTCPGLGLGPNSDPETLEDYFKGFKIKRKERINSNGMARKQENFNSILSEYNIDNYLNEGCLIASLILEEKQRLINYGKEHQKENERLAKESEENFLKKEEERFNEIIKKNHEDWMLLSHEDGFDN